MWFVHMDRKKNQIFVTWMKKLMWIWETWNVKEALFKLILI